LILPLFILGELLFASSAFNQSLLQWNLKVLQKWLQESKQLSNVRGSKNRW